MTIHLDKSGDPGSPQAKKSPEAPVVTTRVQFKEDLEEALAARSEQVLFSSSRGDTFEVNGEQTSLLTALRLMDIDLTEAYDTAKAAHPDEVEAGRPATGPLNVDGSQRIVDFWDLGEGRGVLVDMDFTTPRPTDTEGQAHVSRLEVVTIVEEPRATA